MISIPKDLTEKKVFQTVEQYINDEGFTIIDKDTDRPWGGFLVIDEGQAEQFISTFFPNQSVKDFIGFDKLSPKILLVAPGKRLSWQYHHRRAEIWRVIGGKAGVVVSDTDKQTPVKMLELGESVSLHQGERHRLVGLDQWGVLAEIWKHTDPENPSDEEDIVRVEDDFGR
ncbi:MAG: phosphoheptose isomerase [Bacteroidetes bacterium]|jgi:mannose-6-phosphate isomerase-like protein (cupin superfamily)|nr:phosphoheptose isomerase [Bacteroidota bacterium]